MSKMDLVTNNSEDPSSGARNGLRRQKDIARFDSHISQFYHIVLCPCQSGGKVQLIRETMTPRIAPVL